MLKMNRSKFFSITLSAILLVLAVGGFYVSISIAETTYWLSLDESFSVEQQAMASDDASTIGLVLVLCSLGLLILAIKCFEIFLDLRRTNGV